VRSGGVEPNVVPPVAEADVNFRTVEPAASVRELLDATMPDTVAVDDVMVVPPVRMTTLPGFETAPFSFTTDIPFLTSWGKPLLVGPGSIHVAHTAEEHVQIDELVQAVDLYENLARDLLAAES
jgi:acetylornithine deacetylase